MVHSQSGNAHMVEIRGDRVCMFVNLFSSDYPPRLYITCTFQKCDQSAKTSWFPLSLIIPKPDLPGTMAWRQTALPVMEAQGCPASICLWGLLGASDAPTRPWAWLDIGQGQENLLWLALQGVLCGIIFQMRGGTLSRKHCCSAEFMTPQTVPRPQATCSDLLFTFIAASASLGWRNEHRDCIPVWPNHLLVTDALSAPRGCWPLCFVGLTELLE